MNKLLAVLALGACTSSSPLVESSPQIELTSNPGGLADHGALELTLTTWNHLAALGDAVDAGEVRATLDGTALVIDPVATGYFGNGDRYVAAFTLPAVRSANGALPSARTSRMTITDQQTTWSFDVTDLMTNDVQPQGALVAGQPSIVEWPSAAKDDIAQSTIAWACVDIASRGAACRGNGDSDPGITITGQYITIDLPAAAGDAYRVWGAREIGAQTSGNGPDVLVTVLGQTTGTFGAQVP